MKKVIYIVAIFAFLSVTYHGDQARINTGKSADAEPVKMIKLVEASSFLKDKKNRYRVENLIDKTRASWCEGESGEGIGTGIKVYFTEYKSYIKKLYIKNGYGVTKYFSANNRVKELGILSLIDYKRVGRITLRDTDEVQVFDLSYLGYMKKGFEFVINGVYRGEKWNDTCLTEISFKPIKF